MKAFCYIKAISFYLERPAKARNQSRNEKANDSFLIYLFAARQLRQEGELTQSALTLLAGNFNGGFVV